MSRVQATTVRAKSAPSSCGDDTVPQGSANNIEQRTDHDTKVSVNTDDVVEQAQITEWRRLIIYASENGIALTPIKSVDLRLIVDISAMSESEPIDGAAAKANDTIDEPAPIPSPKPGTPVSRSGWDGKLRVQKQATLANPEALSDPEYSDDDAPPLQQIEADEDLLEGEDPDIEDVDVQHSRVSSIPALHLERFHKLRRICLRQNQIQRIELPDTCISTLEELELYDNLLKHIEGLEQFTALTSLDLSYNKLKHIKRLETLTKLDHLYLVQNRISKVEGLEELTNLTYLELGANRIREIECLEKLVKLESLWLGQNKITELKGLGTLCNLRTLSIQANRLTSLAGIETIPQLTELYFSDNKITSLEPLRHNTKLEILDFQTNPITTLSGIEELNDLENVWASNCKIESFQEVERALKDKAKLEEVYFEGNPLQRQNPVLYRNKVRLALPQVSKIDAAYVKVS